MLFVHAKSFRKKISRLEIVFIISFHYTTALFYYKLGQTFLQIGAASLLQIGAIAVTNLGSYYKLGQRLLQNRAAITNSGTYYKLG